jgi:hypothetical protein
MLKKILICQGTIILLVWLFTRICWELKESNLLFIEDILGASICFLWACALHGLI